MDEREKRAPHILGTSANLLGFCFIVLTSRQVMALKGASIIDELTACAIVIFMASCLLSFLAMRSKTQAGERYEKIADVVFLVGLFFLFVTAVLITMNIIA